MKEEIDIIKKLKDFPKGIKFYSLVYGEVKFVGLTEDRIICETPISKLRHSYNRFGQLVLENETLSSEQILQPDERGSSWKYHKPDGNLKFKIGYVIVPKKGDFQTPWRIVSLDNNYYVCDKGLLPFFKEDEWKWFRFYKEAWVILQHSPGKVHRISEVSGDLMIYKLENDPKSYSVLDGGIRYWRPTDAKKGDLLLASQEETSYSSRHFYTIFLGLDKDGKVVGLGKFPVYSPQRDYCLDKITFSRTNVSFEPTKDSEKDKLLKVFVYLGIISSVDSECFIKVERFNVNTLKPFDKVLVKKTIGDGDVWRAELFSYIEEGYDHFNRYRCVSCNDTFTKCVPYNKDTEHLAGTALEAPDYYINWLDYGR